MTATAQAAAVGGKSSAVAASMLRKYGPGCEQKHERRDQEKAVHGLNYMPVSGRSMGKLDPVKQ
jgi:hypothetical protein